MTPEQFKTTPVGFVTMILGLDLYKWQSDALTHMERAIGPEGKVTQIAVVSPNEAGKSSRIVAGAALYWVTAFKRGKIAITTKDSKQLNEQIIPAIEAHRKKLGYQSVRSPYYRLTTPTGGVVVAYTTDDAGRVEGLHSDGPDAPLLWIVDEAKSVDEPIFQGIDRCGYRVLLYTSSPGTMQGTFYKACTSNRSQFKVVVAGLKDCPHIDPDKINRIVEKWGEDHPFTRSSIYGEFMSQDDESQFFVPFHVLERCYVNPPKPKPGFVCYFCDFAGGNADNVIVKRNGNIYTVIDKWKDVDKTRAVGRFINRFRTEGARQEQIWGDAADKEMLDLMDDMGWTINRQNFGATAMDEEAYSSWSAEAWSNGSKAIEKCEVILPEDDQFKEQVTSRRKMFTARGKIAAEDKYMMAKAGIPSPDIVDCVFGAMAMRDWSGMYEKEPLNVGGWREEFGKESDEKFLESIGANAGL